MTKNTWNSMRNHIDTEKEEQMRWVKIGKYRTESLRSHYWRIWDSALRPKRMAFKACLPAQLYPRPGYLWYTEWQLIRKIENQLKRVIKLTKSINHGNKERNLRNKSEAIHLLEDFQNQYESLYSLYEDLREQVKKNIGVGDDNSSSRSNSDSESYYTPGGSNTSRSHAKSNSKDSDSSSDNKEHDQASDLENTILKDKLTCSSEVKNISESGDFLNLRVREEESERTISQKMARIKVLEEQVESLKLEVSTLCMEQSVLKEKLDRKSNEAVQTKENVESFKIEISTLCMENRKLKEQVESKSDEAMQMKDRISRLEIEAESKENERRSYLSRISELVTRVKEMQLESDTMRNQKCELERQVCLVKQSDQDNEQKYLSRISELVGQANDKQIELDCLRNQKSELEQRFLSETEKSTTRVESLMEKVNTLKQELANVNSELEKKSKTTSECSIRIENLKNELNTNKQRSTDEKEGLEAKIHDLESKIHSILVTKIELEDQVEKLSREISEKDNILSTERENFTNFRDVTSTKTNALAEEVESLKAELDIIRNEKIVLQKALGTLRDDKNRLLLELEKEKEESWSIKSQFEKLSKSNFQIVERKVDEMAEEFRKQLEDKYRILSRRIRVAEQLQVENKEWYRRTKESYEQQNRDLKNRAERNAIELKNIKDMTLTANEVLTSLDKVGLNFEECSGNFLNRISKASCELKFAKHWAMRKNKAASHAKDDLDCLLGQLDDKEGEILVYREKVWKSENKLREMEKMVKEKEDAMLGLMEEKREAIRQLCVWIDYHRGRSDYYMKMASDMMNPIRKKTS